MTRHTSKTHGITSETEFYTRLDAISEMTVQRDKAKVKLDKALLDAREKYGPEVEWYNDRIAAQMALAESFALRHRDTLFRDDAKSAETSKARFGFRLGNPALALLNSKYKWKMIPDKLMEHGWQEYLKITDPKPDKDRLKAELTDDQLAQVGLRIKQEESFWMEPKTDSGEIINA